MHDITAKEQKIVDAIIEFTTQCGYSPTIQELGTMVDIRSTGSMSNYIRRLEMKGILATEERSPRTIRVRGYGFLDERTEADKNVEGKTYKRTLDVISEWMLTKGYVPSVREICILTGLKSTSTVYKHLDYLQENNKIDMRGAACTPRAMIVKGIIYGKLGE